MPKRTKKPKKVKTTLWQGPCNKSTQGGVTQSLIGRFLVCRERFRVLVVEGLEPDSGFRHQLEYGNMWHVCEEYHAKHEDCIPPLIKLVQRLAKDYPIEREKIEHWYNVCKVQFPAYIKFWKKHPDVKNRTTLYQEQVFNVAYKLPSGRTVYLRGKWDGVDYIGPAKKQRVFLQENKTKGDINEEQMVKQLGFDLQTMFYLTTLKLWLAKTVPDHPPIAGARYNVIRRPLSGGKGSIRRHKPSKSKPQGESKEEFYDRVRGIIEDDPKHFFMRWQVIITGADIQRFEKRFLIPVLEQLCDWWHGMECGGDPFTVGTNHWQHPYGIYNSLNEGRATHLDDYLSNGSTL